ncbi:MAG: L,D-transpeptidase family protein [Rubripirellula sp.]|nr:L,D-transpeptidase family protein [Rubripirellula sp.]
MQTLKTAAIVVLLMTVMYGAYVSLITPNEPLPADVEDMLAASEEESLAIDVGLPASLGEMSLGNPAASPGTVSGGNLNTATGLPDDGTLSANAATAIDSLGSERGASGLAAPPVTASFSDITPSSSATPTAEFGPNVGVESGSVGLANSQPISQPISQPVSQPVSQPSDFAAAPGATEIPARSGSPEQLPPNYPITANTFDLPDPNQASLDSGFPSAAAPQFALASGTTSVDPDLTGSQPPAQAIPSAEGIQMGSGLSNAIITADSQFREDRLEQALATLSLFYNSPTISGEERSALLARLDPLAREVIYSKRHLLEQPYRIGQSETLASVAAKYEVPWQLLANINQISDPVTILPGTELKVVRGPFRAEVNLTQKELTLFLGDLYAGRFPIGVGNDPLPSPGTFTVQDKQLDHTYYNAAGTPIPAGSRDNPYGKVWLDLGGQICIHGSPSTTSPTDKGCISLAGDFAEDLYGILTQGSSVTIRR